MKLYYFPFSPNSTQCLALAYHLNVELELQVVDLRAGEQRQPWFVAINPNHFLPTLQDGDFVLWESNAILQELARRAGPTEVWPEDVRTRIDIDRWMFWKVAQWYPTIHTLQIERMLKGGAPPDEAKVAAATTDFRHWCDVLEATLGKQPYLAGQSLTLADFSVAAPLALHKPASLPWDGYPAIQEWYARVAALPAWQKSIPESWR